MTILQRRGRTGPLSPSRRLGREVCWPAGEQLHLRCFGEGGRPFILIDGRYGASAAVASAVHAASANRLVVASCLPGAGKSDVVEQDTGILPMSDLLDAEIIRVGPAAGAAKQLGSRADDCGGHLLAAWQRVRDTHLYADPATPTRSALVRNAMPELARLQTDLLALFRLRTPLTIPDLVTMPVDPNA